MEKIRMFEAMPSSKTLSADARGLTKAAKSADEPGNIEQARAPCAFKQPASSTK
ncbi:MAG: hypothetical protein Q8M95_12710 [Candidatus Methanoperedens sp.]|nr:hypothetical protein [Candidatus Methanoperedens sp.]